MSESVPVLEAPRRWTFRRALAAAAEIDWPAALRPAFVALQAGSILVTWQLWQARAAPPLLPVLDRLPQVDLGLVLLATLVLVLFRPFAGALSHLVVLAVACVLDQTRMQPEFISLALILLGTAPVGYARVIAKAHLVTLWLWAGLNKALSLGFSRAAHAGCTTRSRSTSAGSNRISDG